MVRASTRFWPANDTLCADDVRGAAEDVRALGEETDDKFNNMPDGLQSGPTGEQLAARSDACLTAADELDGIADRMDELDSDLPADGEEGDALEDALDDLRSEAWSVLGRQRAGLSAMVYILKDSPNWYWVMFNHAQIGALRTNERHGKWIAMLYHGGHYFLTGIFDTQDDAKADVVCKHHLIGQDVGYQERFDVLHEMETAADLRRQVDRLESRKESS